MNIEFQKCLEKNKITLFPKGKRLAGKEISVARSDLFDAKAGYENERYKWATIQAYCAMFHAARALIYSSGYREKGHYCLAVALKALYVENKKLDTQSVRDFLNAMNLREVADYESHFSKDGAAAVINSAEKFIERATAILGCSE